MIQGIDDGDVRVDLNGAAIEDGRAVLPLAHGVHGGLVKERITGKNLERLNGAVGGNDGLQLNSSFATKLNANGGIARFDAVSKTSGVDVADGDAWRLLRMGVFADIGTLGN